MRKKSTTKRNFLILTFLVIIGVLFVYNRYSPPSIFVAVCFHYLCVVGLLIIPIRQIVVNIRNRMGPEVDREANFTFWAVNLIFGLVTFVGLCFLGGLVE